MLGKSESHQKRTLVLLKRHLFPWLNRPIAEIKAPELLKILERIKSRNAMETAHSALQTSGQEHNPRIGLLKIALAFKLWFVRVVTVCVSIILRDNKARLMTIANEASKII